MLLTEHITTTEIKIKNCTLHLSLSHKFWVSHPKVNAKIFRIINVCEVLEISSAEKLDVPAVDRMFSPFCLARER